MNRENTKQQWKYSYSIQLVILQGSIYFIKSHNFVVEIFHILAKFFPAVWSYWESQISLSLRFAFFACWDLGHNVLNSFFSFGPKRFPFSITWMCNIHLKETLSFRVWYFFANRPSWNLPVSVQGNLRLPFLMAKHCRSHCECFLSHSTSGPSASPAGF